MDKKFLLKLIIILIFISLIVSLIVIINAIFKLSKEYNSLNKFTSKTSGTITKVIEYKGSEDRYTSNLAVDYEINEKKYSIYENYKSTRKLEFNVGDQITVVYDKENPDYCIPETIYEWRKNENKISKTACAYSVIREILILAVFSYISKKYVFEK